MVVLLTDDLSNTYILVNKTTLLLMIELLMSLIFMPIWTVLRITLFWKTMFPALTKDTPIVSEFMNTELTIDKAGAVLIKLPAVASMLETLIIPFGCCYCPQLFIWTLEIVPAAVLLVNAGGFKVASHSWNWLR